MDEHSLRIEADGHLPAETYRRLYEVASRGGTFVEIGTHHGAATIALALGALDAGRPFHIFTADSLTDPYSSLRAYGSPEDNANIIRHNFAKFNVSEFIDFVVGSSDAVLPLCPNRVDILLLDADGMIDRDLRAFYPVLAHDALIIIDDLGGGIYPFSVDGQQYLSQKQRLGQLLSDIFVKEGLLIPVDRLRETGFFRKGEGDVAQLQPQIMSAYKALACIPFNMLPPYQFSRKQALATLFPKAAALYRQLRRK